MSVPPNTGPQDPFGQPPQQAPGSTPYGGQQPGYPPPAPAYGQQPGHGQQPAYGQQPPAYPAPTQNTYPQPGYPQQAAGYGQMPPPPPGSYGAGPQTRPGQVTGAAVLGFVVGGLGLIGNFIALSLSAAVADLTGGSLGFLKVLSVLGIIIAAGYIWGGLQAMSGKDGRILLGVAAGGVLINIITMIVYFQTTALISFVLPGIIIFLLMSKEAKSWFDRKGAKHF